MALLDRGLLVEPVPVAAAYSAHERFASDFLPKSLGKFTRSRLPFAQITRA
jgi:hypothetical protein